MACRHEGGTGRCKRTKAGHCPARDRIYRRFRKHGTAFTGGDRGKSTAACELLVRADLSKRGFEVTVPVSPTAKHDLHVELPSVGWKGVQIRAGVLNTRTNILYNQPRKVFSPILALVYLPDSRIEYRKGTEIVPEELKEMGCKKSKK